MLPAWNFRDRFNLPSPRGVAMAVHPGPEKRRIAEIKLADLDPIRQALQNNEDLYQDLLEHSQDLFCIHDLKGWLLSVNPASARVLGYSVEELLRIPMREIIAPEFRSEFDAYLKQIERAGEAHGLLAVLTRSGEQRIWEYHNSLRTEGVAVPIVCGIAHDITEQRRTEKRLREASESLLDKVHESEQTIRELKLFRTLVDQSNDPVKVIDPETLRFLDVNQKACTELGYSREELLSLGVFDVVPVATQSSTAKIKMELQKSGFIVMETLHRRKDGSTFPVEVSMRWVQLEREYIVAIARDLTERKLTEARLREYERVVEGLEEVIAVVDRDYRYVIANREFLKRRNIKKEELVGRTVMDHLRSAGMSEEGVALVKDKLDECFRGKVVQYELTYQYPLLGQRDLFLSYFPIEGPTGVDRIACVLQDITERRLAEEALRTSERHQHKIANQLEAERARLIEAQAVAKVGSWEAELPSLEITWSEQTHRIFETDPSRFHPRRPDFVEFIHPEDRVKVDAACQASLDKGAPSNVEYRIVMADGRVKVLEEQWKVFHNEQGRPIRLVGTCRDVTEQKRAEEALRRSEENYRNFVSQSSEGIFRDDLMPPVPIDLPEDEFIDRFLHDTVIVECNDAMAAMYGFASGEELRGRRMSERVVPEDPLNIELAREFVSSGFRLLEHESHEVDRYGNPKIFLNSMIGTVEDRKLVRVWGIQRDITEKVKLENSRRKAEEALHLNVAQLREVTEELRLAKEKLREEKLYLEQSIDTELGFGEIIGRSSALKEVMQKVAKVAPSDATVLLLGETGTGKELVARALHRMSHREGKSFIKLNCAAIPSGLLESELFGHEKGAFTGAVSRKLGRLELADRGTLFLDEVGEIPLSLQPKLLRVLQDLEFERLGGTQTLKVNFRLLAATNRDLPQSVKGREFRSDLYYRLNVFPILIPPLRERREDIRPLIEHFVRKFAVQMKKSITSIPSKTMEMLVRWDWPGNIRELENFVERSVILTPGSVLQAPLSELHTAVEQGTSSSATFRDKERERILRVLRDCRGKLGGPDGAAARLGLKRTTLQSKLDQLAIKPGSFRV
jgi:PAS domain S-box-containing protein